MGVGSDTSAVVEEEQPNDVDGYDSSPTGRCDRNNRTEGSRVQCYTADTDDIAVDRLIHILSYKVSFTSHVVPLHT